MRLRLVIHSLVLCAAMPIALSAQEPVPDIRRHWIQSNAPNEEYLIQVSLPDDYADSDAQLAVLYVLDAEKSFGLVRDVVDWLSWAREIPALIVVGISYGEDTDSWWRKRSRDLTPSLDSVGPYGEWPRSGGADQFREFIRTELFPFIENTYRASGVRGVVGLSFGGLFGFYDLLSAERLFHWYVLVSPALAWDNELVASLERSRSQSLAGLPARVYTAVGDADAPNVIEPWKRLDAKLQTRGYEGFHYLSEVLADETHISAFPIAVTHGLKAVSNER